MHRILIFSTLFFTGILFSEENALKKSKTFIPPYSEAARGVIVGGIYQHYKGPMYRVLSIGRHSESVDEVVTYQALYGDKNIWVRPLEMFTENVVINGQETPRFKLILKNDETSVLTYPASHFFNCLSGNGYVEIGNTRWGKEEYSQLYDEFDHFIDLMSSDELVYNEIKDSEDEFLADRELNSRYCQAPPSYRDPNKDVQKRHNKIYFQFMKEHYEILQKNHQALLDAHPEIKSFLDRMLKIDQIARVVFAQVLKDIQCDCPEIQQMQLGDNAEFTIVSKIVRYKKSEKWGTTPHFDKSGLTLVFDSSDKNNEGFVLCMDTQHPSLEKLQNPERIFDYSQGVNSILLIPGACLSKINIQLPPTLHGVLPLEDEYRYSVMSFALVPNIDVKDMPTDWIE